MSPEDIYINLEQILQNSSRTNDLAKPGLCRRWAQIAVKEIIKYRDINRLNLNIEVREVDISHALSHTFLRVRVLPDGEPYLYDGTGVENFPPFMGYEKAAPTHLRESRTDWIQKQLFLDND